MKQNLSSQSWTGKYMTLDEIRHFLLKATNAGASGSLVPTVSVTWRGQIKEIHLTVHDTSAEHTDYSE